MVSSMKELAVVLSKLKVFERASEHLEQYATDSEVAAEVLWSASMRGDIEGKHVADLGCGTGVLGIGALLLGARYLTFVDMDESALATLRENLRFLENEYGELYENYEAFCRDIDDFDTVVDVVIMNPPFGTRTKHADVLFLAKALSISPVVYSMHKTSTEEFLSKWVTKQGAKITSRWRFAFPLKATMEHHERRIQRIEVTCLRFER
jgi:putative methylase